MLEKEYPWFKEHINLLNKKNYSHSYLIGGKQGLAKEVFAEVFSQSLLCAVSEEFQPCGNCNSCRLFKSESNPDFHQIVKEEGKSFISLNQVKEIQSKIYTTSFLGNSKVFLIKSAETITREASDSLLKSLEEPPANTYFILVSNSPHNISITIKSRCREISIKQPSVNHLKDWSINKNYNFNEFSKALKLTSGNILKASAHLDDDVLTHRKAFIEELGSLIKRGDNLLELSASWSKKSPELIINLEWMSMLLMDAIRYKLKNQSISIQEDTANISQYLSEKVNHQVLYSLLQDTNKLWSTLSGGSSLKVDYLVRSLFIHWNTKLNIAPA